MKDKFFIYGNEVGSYNYNEHREEIEFYTTTGHLICTIAYDRETWNSLRVYNSMCNSNMYDMLKNYFGDSAEI